MFTIEKASPYSEDYLLDPVQYYLRSRRRKKKKGTFGEPYDDDSPDDGPDDEPGFGDADPYTIDMPGEPPGRWFPSVAAATLELSGLVLEVPYRRVFRGFHPYTQKPLVQNAGMPNRRPGWECCLSAPKDVSVLWSQLLPADRERLQLCNWLAAEDTIKWIEENFVFSRVGKAKEGCQYVPVSLVAPMFEHASSRALDPDLHIHFQLLNLGVDKDGNVRTIDPILIFKNQKLITAYYRAALAAAIRDEFGLTIEVHGHTFRIRGVPQELVKAQSKRSQQILDHMAKTGQSGGAAAHRVALETRPQKDPYISREELFRKWRAENALFRFDDAYVARLIRPKPPARIQRLAPTGEAAVRGHEPATNSTASGRQPRRYSPRTCKKLIKRAIRRALRRRNHFSEHELVLYTLYELPAFGVPPAMVPAEVRNYLKKNQDIVPLGSHEGDQRFTTKQILQEEARMLAALERATKRSGRRVSDKKLNRELKKRPTLKQEQIEFIHHLTQSNSAFRIGLGYAGVGKTYTLKTAVDACHRQGLRVIGVAPTGKAAEVLAAEAGIPCQTLTKFLADYRLPFSAAVKHHLRQLWRTARHRKTWRFRQPRPKQLTSRDIVLVDEAGMISTTYMRKLAELVERYGATLWVVGDPAQLPSVAGTPPLEYLAKRYGAPVLKEIRRQDEEWAKQAARKAAEGDIGSTLAMLAEHKQITVRDKEDEAVRQACLDWTEEGLLTPDRALILANTNDISHKANLLAQEHRLRAGCLQPSPSIRITDEQDEAVYESRVYRGDRVIFTQNTPDPPRGSGVRNGSRGSVIEINAFTGEIAVLLDNKKYVKVNVRKYPHIRLGYAVTTWKSQGASIPKIFAIVGGTGQNLPASYVQATRAIEQTQFYTTSDLLNPHLEDAATSPLAKQMSRKPDLRLATELLDNAPLDLRPRRLRIDNRLDEPPIEKQLRMEIVGIPSHFWLVERPAPDSLLGSICRRCRFKRFTFLAKKGLAVNELVGVYADQKAAVLAALKSLKAVRDGDTAAPLRTGNDSMEVVGMPSAFWLVTRPTPDSQLADICRHIDFPAYILEVRDGLCVKDIVGVYANKQTAVAVASELLDCSRQSHAAEAAVSRASTPHPAAGRVDCDLDAAGDKQEASRPPNDTTEVIASKSPQTSAIAQSASESASKSPRPRMVPTTLAAFSAASASPPGSDSMTHAESPSNHGKKPKCPVRPRHKKSNKQTAHSPRAERWKQVAKSIEPHSTSSGLPPSSQAAHENSRAAKQSTTQPAPASTAPDNFPPHVIQELAVMYYYRLAVFSAEYKTLDEFVEALTNSPEFALSLFRWRELDRERQIAEQERSARQVHSTPSYGDYSSSVVSPSPLPTFSPTTSSTTSSFSSVPMCGPSQQNSWEEQQNQQRQAQQAAMAQVWTTQQNQQAQQTAIAFIQRNT